LPSELTPLSPVGFGSGPAGMPRARYRYMTIPATQIRADRPTEVYVSLRDLIVRGRLAPGTRIIESEIAARLGVSRTPVRSALHRLQQEGYVIETDGGARARLSVAPLTKDDGEEIFNVVAEVEGLAARFAARLDAPDRGRVAGELRAINADLRRAAEAERPDPNRFFELDRGFHRRYVEASGRRRVIALHDAIKPQAHRYNYVYTSVLVDTIRTSASEHDEIIAALEKGDPDATQRAVQANWRNAAERLSVVIDRLGERGSW